MGPGWRPKRANYTKEEGSFSEVGLKEFDRKMEKLIQDCHDTVRPGGHVAILIQNTTEYPTGFQVFFGPRILPRKKEAMASGS